MPWVTPHHPRNEDLDACVQCGLCLPVCPTFRLTGRETASPRGRLHAMSAVRDGIVPVDRRFAEIIDFCLGCRACEPICPGLVPYGRALEGARAEIRAQVSGRSSNDRLIVEWLIPRRWLMRLGTRLLRLAQALRITGLAPARMRRTVQGTRSLSGRGAPLLGHSGGTGRSATVGLLTGCIQDEWFRPVNRAAVTLLELAGHRVEAPQGQTCCGALASHSGRVELADRFAEDNLRTFSGYDLVVATAAGCSAHLADLGAYPVLDVTVAVARAIADGRLPILSGDRGPIVIQDPCHLRHAQGVVEEPRAILSAAGFTVVETDDDGMCCGAAGLYAVGHPETSADLGTRKADQIRSTSVMKVASANPGCEMQLRSHLGQEFVVAHPIEWYLSALGEEQ